MNSAQEGPVIEPLGDAALLLVFGDSIDASVNERVLCFRDWMRETLRDGIQDLVPAYASLAVLYDPLVWDFATLAGVLAQADPAPGIAIREARVVEVPVCYEAEYAPDLAEVCAHSGVSEEELEKLHSEAIYRVCFLGFVAGFPYLDGLHPRLHVPRLASPRLEVAAGSVAIGGQQAGIYPLSSPGGWRIIGRTPLRLFAADRSPRCLLRAGDRLRFVSVTRGEFARIAAHSGAAS